MATSMCPYLGGRSQRNERRPGLDYPSFENHCFALPVTDPEHQQPVLLADQATFCLGSGYRHCASYQAIHGVTPASTADILGTDVPAIADILDSADAPAAPALTPDIDLDGGIGLDEPLPWPSLWLVATVLTAVILLCGGSLAAYAGWQLVSHGTLDLRGRLSALAAPTTTTAPEPLFVVITATSVPPATQPPSLSSAGLPVTPSYDFPVAVTATPAAGGALAPAVITTPTPPSDDASVAPDLATAVAAPVVITTPTRWPGLATPTRRPTPAAADGSSSLPAMTAPPAAATTPTPAGPVSTPIVHFQSGRQSVLPGECTTLSWEVENARAVFLENEGVTGRGERRVCRRWTSGVYTLTVVSLDGTEQIHTVEVQLIPHTVTPLPTATFTPVLTPTPTWTPVGPPTQTPVPPQYGVTLTVDGGNQRSCAPGKSCEIWLQLGNTGDLADEVFLNLANAGPWPVQLCRLDGICGETVVSVGVSPGVPQNIIFRLAVPAAAGGQSASYQLQADSGNANHAVKSETVLLSISVP